MQQYKVQKKDTLWKIAKHFGKTVEEIAAVNNLRGRQIHLIRVDQILNIPDDEPTAPDTYITLRFRALDFSSITPKSIKVMCDGTEKEYRLSDDNTVDIVVDDHALGLSVSIESIDNKKSKIFQTETLPFGRWMLSLDSRMIKSDGVLQPEKGNQNLSEDEIKKNVTHNAQIQDGKTQHEQARTEGGAPTHGVATIYTERNLRLLQGNEKYRKYIIEAADKYALTPQSLAALITAEAAKIDGVWQEKSNSDYPAKAQGLAQFFPDAWEDVFNDEKSLLHLNFKTATSKVRLAKRLDARYAIDGAASYASLNLRNFANRGFAVNELPPEDKARIAYLLHHEGLTGTLRLFGKEKQLSDQELQNRLRKQFGPEGEEKFREVLERYENNPELAYNGWLLSYIDSKVQVNNYIVNDVQKFAKQPRTTAAIIKDLTASFVAPKPKPKKKPSKQSAPSRPPSQPKPDVKSEAPPHQDVARHPISNIRSMWHDPLDICTLRTVGLANKRGAMFGWTREGGKKNHQGIDLIAEPGTPIYAVADGIVRRGKNPTPGYAYGKTLILEVNIDDLPPPQAAEFRKINPNGRTIGFFYAHLSETPKEATTIVRCGDIIGKTGCSGNASNMKTIAQGAHLHFEVRLKAMEISTGLTNRADPLSFIENCTNR